MSIKVQSESFDLNHILLEMKKDNAAIGAAVSFTGFVRELIKVPQSEQLTSLYLEHYPGMTEKSLSGIVEQAVARWSIADALIVHRVGKLKPLDQIVLVLVASAHRKDAFAACEFMMDLLKTEAPFWKKEITKENSRWVEAKESDDHMRLRWNN